MQSKRSYKVELVKMVADFRNTDLRFYAVPNHDSYGYISSTCGRERNNDFYTLIRKMDENGVVKTMGGGYAGTVQRLIYGVLSRDGYSLTNVFEISSKDFYRLGKPSKLFIEETKKVLPLKQKD